MSTVDKTVDISMRAGMDLRSLDRSGGPPTRGVTPGCPYLQNVIPRNGELLVRAGFGTVRQYGTTLNAGRIEEDGAFGLGACIGATLVKTQWGAEQVLALHPLFAFTGDLKGTDTLDDLAQRSGVYLAGVCAVVHDLHSGRHFEFVLHEQDAQSDDLMNWFPNYATRVNNDRSRWSRPAKEPQWAVFTQCGTGIGGLPQRNTVVAIDGMGLWTYRPVDSPLVPNRQNDSMDRLWLGPLMGEHCAFAPLELAPGPGTAAEGYAYLTTADLGTVDALTTWNSNQVVYGVGNTVWFADPGNPQQVLFDNSYVLPTADTITLLAPSRGGIVVATANQCWVLQPSNAGNQDAANLTLVELGKGCASNRSYCLTDAGVVFVDSRGAYLYTGGLDTIALSPKIDRLWSDPQSLQLPLTDFYVHAGVTGLTATQMASRIDVREQIVSARLCWDQQQQTLFVVCDDVTLCWTADFGWSVWLFQTHAGSSLQVQGLANIVNPTFVSATSGLYAIAGPDSVTYSDTTLDRTVVDNSCSLLHLGRGGAIDRSTCARPSTPTVYKGVLSGYIVTTDITRLTINGTDYDYPFVDGDDFAAVYAGLAVLAAADPDYDVVADLDGVVCIAKVYGTGAPAVSGVEVAPSLGVFTVSVVSQGTDADLDEADLEDEREPVGGWVKFTPGADPGTAFMVGKPTVVPPGFAAPGVAVAETRQTYWFPISIMHGGILTLSDTLSLHFQFDNRAWEPICADATLGEVAFVLPDERLASEAGYSRGAPLPTRQIRIFGGGVPDPAGDESRLDFDGAAGAWTAAPSINVSVLGPDTIVYVGFRYLLEVPGSQLVTEFWLEPTIVGVPQIGPAGATLDAVVYWWQSGRYPVEQEAWANLQQPVDWVAKTRNAEGGNGCQIRVRGVQITALHQGAGTDVVVPNWRYGPLNTATSTDARDYSAQALDFGSTPPGNSEQNAVGVYPRMVETGSVADPSTKTAANIARWGDIADPSVGNLLIDDAAVDSLATTDGSQGARASVMLHGTMNSAGESVRVGEVQAVLRKMGNMQRWR